MAEATLKTSERFPVGSLWRNKRSGIVAKVEGIDGDCLVLSRQDMATTRKWINHFVREYLPAEAPEPLTRTRLDDMLDSFADAYGAAVLAANSGRGYQEATEKAVEAKQAILKVVFP